MNDAANLTGPAKADPGPHVNGTGWLFLHAPGGGDDGVFTAESFSNHLIAIGLTSSENIAAAHGDGAPVRLHFADTALLLITGPVAREALFSATQTAVHAVGTSIPAHLDGDTIIGLRLADEGAGRAAGLRRLCAVAALLIPVIGASHIYWQPARLWSPAAELARAVIAMEESGLPPVLHLVAFGQMRWRNVRMQSFGLGWIVGQELRIDAPHGYDVAALLRVAARLAVDAMLHGGLSGPMAVAGLQPGESLHIRAAQQAEAPKDDDAPEASETEASETVASETVAIVPVRILRS